MVPRDDKTVNYPFNEIKWVTLMRDGKTAWIITSNRSRETYYLYSVTGRDATRLASAKTPVGLYNKTAEL